MFEYLLAGKRSGDCMPGAGLGGDADQEGMEEGIESGKNVDFVAVRGFRKETEAGFGVEAESICGGAGGGSSDRVCREGERDGEAGGGG